MTKNTSYSKALPFILIEAVLVAITILAFTNASVAKADTLQRQLQIGMSGSDVSSLQSFLAQDENIYPQGLVTGYFGFLTKSAVSNFQDRNNILTVGRVGPITLSAINAQMTGGIGGSDDNSAPVIYPITVSTGTNGATLSWTTNGATLSRVMYGTSWPFLYSTAPSVASANGFSSTANVTLSGLQPRSTYYYVVESVDGAGNVSWTVGKPLFTQ